MLFLLKQSCIRRCFNSMKSYKCRFLLVAHWRLYFRRAGDVCLGKRFAETEVTLESGLCADLSVLAPDADFLSILSEGSMARPASGGLHRLRRPDSFDEVRKSGLFRSSTPCHLLSRHFALRSFRGRNMNARLRKLIADASRGAIVPNSYSFLM